MVRNKHFDTEKFCRHIQGQRWGGGLSMQQVADQIGTTKTQYFRWENAKAKVPSGFFLGLCHLFDLDPCAYYSPASNFTKTELMNI